MYFSRKEPGLSLLNMAAKVVADSPLLRTLIEKHDEEKEEPPELPKVLIWEKQFGTWSTIVTGTEGVGQWKDTRSQMDDQDTIENKILIVFKILFFTMPLLQ